MKLLNDYASQLLIQKIGITLLSSLALGLLMALLTGLVLFFTKRSSADVRYNLLTSLLCLFTISIGVVLYQQLTQDRSQEVAGPQVQIVSILVGGDLGNGNASGSENFKAIIWTFLSANTSTITIVWLLIVLFKALQMAKGLYELRYLKRNKVYSIGRHWETRTADLALKIGINRSLKVLQSGLVKIPMVMGHFKPVILIPLGVITNIPADQIEMILLHELAHIKRMDFFVNLLQHFVELLFFFNPAVLWLSGLIRKERENCCDDMAVRLSGSKKTYINALLSFREYQLAEPVYAMAFAKDSTLVERAKRIAFQKNTSLKLSEKVILGVTILILLTFTIVVAQVTKDNSQSHIDKTKVTDKIKSAALAFPVTQKGISEDQSVRDLKLDQYLENLKGQTARLQSNNPYSGDSLLKSQSTLGRSSTELFQLDTLSKARYRGSVHLEPLQGLKPLFTDQSPDSSAHFSNYSGYKTNQNLFIHAENQEFESPYDRFDYKPIQIKLNKSINEQILDEIENAGVVYDRKHVQLHITNTELVVNGVRQSDEIHEKAISKFIRKPGDIIDFSFGSGMK